MLEALTTNTFTYEKLSPEEMAQRGILGRLVGVIADTVNPTRNGRKYSEKLWDNVFNDPIMKERIENNCCFGELGHPTDREETDMEKIAIVMDGLPKKDNKGRLQAIFNIIDTPNGRILKSLCDYGCSIGISSRGSGDLETDFDGQESVNPDTYSCEGWDAVIIPAVKDARLQYVTESLNLKKDNKTLREQLTESIKNETTDHQKIMKESLASLGINLNESTEKFIITKIDDGKYALAKGNPPVADLRKTIEADSAEEAREILLNSGYSADELITESVHTDYSRMNNAYENSISFDDMDAASGRLRDMIDYLESHNQPYDLYENKTDNGCTLFYDGTLDILESWDNLSTYLTEARLSLAQKLDAWHEGTRKLRIKGYSDLDLWMIYELCLDKGYDEQAQLVKKELEGRGVYDDVEVVMTEDKSALFITSDYAGKAFIRDLNIPNFDPPREVWDVRHGILGYRIKKDDPEADAVVRALIPVLKGKQQNEEFTLSESYSWEDLAELVPVLSGPVDFKESYINEAKMTADEKMDAWHAGSRRENIKACSDSKLTLYRDICKRKGYDEQVAIIENEMTARGLMGASKGDTDSKIIAKMMAGGKELWVMENEASKDFFYNLYGDETWGFEQGMIDEDYYFIIPKTNEDATRIAAKLLPILQKQNNIKEEYSRETDDIDEVSVAVDDDMAIVNELQESLKLNKKLDEKIVTLQERLSASYAKEMELNEAIDSYKIKIIKLSNKAKEHKALTEKLSKLEKELKTSNDEVSSKKNTLHETMRRDATERKSLQESISNKDKEIAKLTEQLKNTQSEVKATNESVESLSEQLETARKDVRQLKEKYTTKLEQSNALIEKYKNIAKKAVDKYIDKQATILGVSSNEVKNRLPESYTFTDIDNVCESLREYKVNMNSLPFNTSKLNENVNLSVKNIDNRTLVRNADDEISDTDLKLAERFMK